MTFTPWPKTKDLNSLRLRCRLLRDREFSIFLVQRAQTYPKDLRKSRNKLSYKRVGFATLAPRPEAKERLAPALILIFETEGKSLSGESGRDRTC